MEQYHTNNMAEVVNDIENVRWGIVDAIDAHQSAIRFAGGDVHKSDIIDELEDALEHIDDAAQCAKWANTMFTERYL